MNSSYFLTPFQSSSIIPPHPVHPPITVFNFSVFWIIRSRPKKKKKVVLVPQSCWTPCNPMNWSSPDFSVHGILQAGIQEWVAIPFSRDLPEPGIKPWTPLHCRRILCPLTHQVSPQGSYPSIKYPQLMLTAAEFAAPGVVAITSWSLGFSRVNVYP